MMRHATDATSSLLLTLLDSVLTRHSAIYAAGPLDTGRSFYEALACGVSHGAGSVRSCNESALSAFASRLRARHHPSPVIDPGRLRVPGWEPKDIGQFFLETISRYAKEAWFIDGWEFSSGATKEYLHCVSLGIPCFTESGEELLLLRATNLLRAAVQQVNHLSVPAPKLESRLVSFQVMLESFES